jgi:hypothetical protein
MLSITIDHHLRAAASENAGTGFKRCKHLFVNHQECFIPRVFAAFGDLHDAENNDAISFETQQHDCKERIQLRFLRATICSGRRRSQPHKNPAVFLVEPSIQIECHSFSPNGNVSPRHPLRRNNAFPGAMFREGKPTIHCSSAGKSVRTMIWPNVRFGTRNCLSADVLVRSSSGSRRKPSCQ